MTSMMQTANQMIEQNKKYFSAVIYPRHSTMSKKDSKMTKAEVMSEISAKTGLSKAQTGTVLDALYDLMAKEIKAGHEFTIPNIGKVVVKRRKARSAREGKNPRTGESVQIKAQPAKNVVRIKPLKAVKDLV